MPPIVDDGSPDGTGHIADRIAEKYDGVFIVLHREEKQGLGKAYMAGFQAALEAGADRIIEMDADHSHPLHSWKGALCTTPECTLQHTISITMYI